MIASLFSRRKALATLAAMAGALALAACEPLPGGGAGGPDLTSGAPVRVALLVPAGSGASSDELIAAHLENAARLAVADIDGAQIDLAVYATAGDPARAAQVAAQAVSDGAAIILGPLYAEEANAAGVAVAASGINVLAFSNNPTIAGGNVFVLGQTFRNTADRLVRYGMRHGITSYLVAHGADLQGQIGRDAITAAVRDNGATLAGVESYALSQAAVQAAAPRIAATARASGAGAIFTTAGVNAELPILATALPEAGLNAASTRFIGLTRWNATPQALSLPGLQGGLFALPDQQMTALFESRYAAAYGTPPHPLASLAYDGIAAVGALVARGGERPLGRAALTQAQGFRGTSGIFRFLADGTNERGLAVAEVRSGQVTVVDAAPRAFGGAGF
ncbi:MAG: penicillin-binding protein activator [Rubellimicrobium sp.]|nr:penicillin-binding protein activator [Rubellimicrobium sp.]